MMMAGVSSRPSAAVAATLLLLFATAQIVSATIYFHEDFNTLDGWVTSSHKSDYGTVKLATGEFFGDAKINQGLQLSDDARFYALSKKIGSPIDNTGHDLVVSFSLKNEQTLTCGGGYIKILPSMDQSAFNGDTNYWLMFGPDRCGSKNKIHIILHHNDKNVDWSKSISYPADKLTHTYTLRISSDNTYELYVDNEKKESGSLESDWSMLPPKTIPDPDEKKPADWVDAAMIVDPEDKKPEDWDDVPAEIPDPDATKPEDWDEGEDGEWEAPPIPNPAYKGKWKPRMINNPAYKGQWKAKEIPNPAYKPNPKLYVTHKPLEYVGVDVWQVEAGSIYDNIIIGDNYDEVKAIVDKTFGATKAKEKELFEAAEEKRASEGKAKSGDADGEYNMDGGDGDDGMDQDDL